MVSDVIAVGHGFNMPRWL